MIVGAFTAEPGYRTWREAGTCDWELIHTVAGSGRFGATRGEELVVGPGHLVLIRPGTPHDYGPSDTATSWGMRWVHFLPPERWLPWLDWPEPAPGLMLRRIPPEQQDALLACWDELQRWSLADLPLQLELAANTLESMLLRIALAAGDNAPHGDEVVAEAIAQLGAGLAVPLDRHALARRLDLSLSRLAHRFSAATGLGLSAYHERLRLQRACVLLDATARRIGDIGAEVGFDDPFYFSQRFRRFTGMSPRAWRSRDRSQDLRPPPEAAGNRAW